MSPSSYRRAERTSLLAARIVLFAAWVPVLLRLGSLDALARRLEPAQPPRGEPSADQVAELVARVDRLVAAAWPLVRRGCLPRGLTRYRFLRELGADVSLRFGIARSNEAWVAHCWVEMAGEPLAERRDPRAGYTEIWRVAPPAPAPGVAPARRASPART